VLFEAFSQLWYANAAVLADGLALLNGGAAQQENYDALTWRMIEVGRTVTATQYQVARYLLDGMTRRIANFMRNFDLVLTPTLSQPALPLGRLDVTSGDLPEQMQIAEAFVAYAPVANAAGFPAISLPLYTSSTGLPVGMQFMAAAGEEALLLQLARQLELALPWADRHPALFG
jgi:amidase